MNQYSVTTELAVIDALCSPATALDLQTNTGLSRRTVMAIVRNLRRAGVVEKLPRHRYGITEIGVFNK